jgi:hypothetical protein
MATHPQGGYPITGRIGGGTTLGLHFTHFFVRRVNETLQGRIPVFPHRFARTAHIGGRANEA